MPGWKRAPYIFAGYVTTCALQFQEMAQWYDCNTTALLCYSRQYSAQHNIQWSCQRDFAKFYSLNMRREIGIFFRENCKISRTPLTVLISSVSTSCNLSFLQPDRRPRCNARYKWSITEKNAEYFLAPFLHMKSCSVSLVCTLSSQIVVASIFMNITAVHRITGQFTEHDNLNKDLQTSYNQEHYHYHQNVRIM